MSKSFSWLFLSLLVALSGCTPAVHYERVGFGLSTQTNAAYWADRLGAGWFVDWSVRAWPAERKVQYWQTIRVQQDETQPDLESVVRMARTYPGQVWIIGNEPDNIWQDNLTPEAYAAMYGKLYRAIKNVDPGAKIAIGGVSQPSELRLKYLERVVSSYREQFGAELPVDWWTVHAYVLREERDSWGAGIPPGIEDDTGLLIEPEQHGDLDIFKGQIMRFRGWMKAQGYQDKPLAVTEFGILLPEEFGYTDKVVADYLKATFAWLDSAADPETGYPLDEGRLVQRWAWFSLADENFPTADLVDLPKREFTPAGNAFQAFTRQRNQP